jgi:uncharacterized protein YjbI with pentapeptide repeats
MSNEKCPLHGCGRGVYQEGRCVFHLELKTTERQLRDFRVALGRLLRVYRREKPEWWDFEGFIFPDSKRIIGRSIHFGEWRYTQKVNFSRAVFQGEANFRNAVFHDQAYFGHATFESWALFEHAVFRSTATHGGAHVHRLGANSFHVIYRSRGCDFWGTNFRHVVQFDNATFLDVASFMHTIFHQGASFAGATFHSWAAFASATFKGWASFGGSNIQGGAEFSSSTFQEVADFSYAIFSSWAIFESAIFFQTARFDHTLFAGEIPFAWPSTPLYGLQEPSVSPLPHGTVHFKEIMYSIIGVLDLSNNDLREGCRVIFEECDLSRVKFVGTDCRKIDFINCTWADCWARTGIGDEYLARFDGKNWWQRVFPQAFRILIPGGDWRRIAITYNELASNYSARLDYVQAYEFDAGVLEMRRLDCIPVRGWRKWVWNKGKVLQWLLAMQHRYVSFMSLYRCFTGYGRRYLRPLVLLVASLPLYAWLYYLILPITDLCCYWPEAITLALQAASLNRYGLTIISEAGLLANVVAVLQVISTATLITLFLFAVRRRFKR